MNPACRALGRCVGHSGAKDYAKMEDTMFEDDKLAIARAFANGYELRIFDLDIGIDDQKRTITIVPGVHVVLESERQMLTTLRDILSDPNNIEIAQHYVKAKLEARPGKRGEIHL